MTNNLEGNRIHNTNYGKPNPLVKNRYWREPNKLESNVSLKEIDEALTFAEGQLEDDLAAIMARQEKAALAELKSGIEPSQLKIRFIDEYKKAISRTIYNAIDKGYGIAAKDLKISKTELPSLKQYVESISSLYAEKEAMDLKFIILMNFYQLKVKASIKQ